MKVQREWQAKFRNWIGGSKYGVLCLGVRRRGRGKWLRPAEVPPEVREYLALKQTAGRGQWYCEDFKTLDDMRQHAHNCKAHLANDGLLIRFKVDEIRAERLLEIGRVVNRLCRDVGRADLFGLYRATYKASTCGVSVGFLIGGLPAYHQARPVYGAKPKADDPIWLYCESLQNLPSLDAMYVEGMRVLGVCITGYVEGWDGELQPIVLQSTRRKRLSVDDYWKAVEQADDEAEEVWKETHGCDDCGPENDCGYRSINPACQTCGGHGAII